MIDWRRIGYISYSIDEPKLNLELNDSFDIHYFNLICLKCRPNYMSDGDFDAGFAAYRTRTPARGARTGRRGTRPGARAFGAAFPNR